MQKRHYVSIVFCLMVCLAYAQQADSLRRAALTRLFSHKDSLFALEEQDRVDPDNWILTVDTISHDSLLRSYYSNGNLKKSILFSPNAHPFVEYRYSNGQLYCQGYVACYDTSWKYYPDFLTGFSPNYIYDYDGDYRQVYYNFRKKEEIYHLRGDYPHGYLFTISVWPNSKYPWPICEFKVDDTEYGWRVRMYWVNRTLRKQNEFSDIVFLKSYFSTVYPQLQCKIQRKYKFRIYKGIVRCRFVYDVKIKKSDQDTLQNTSPNLSNK